MEDDIPSHDALLETLLEHDEIHAAAIAEADGTVYQSRGTSRAIRTSPPDDDNLSTREANDPDEDVYLEAVGGDLLIVAFDIEADIDDIRSGVERIRAKVGS